MNTLPRPYIQVIRARLNIRAGLSVCASCRRQFTSHGVVEENDIVLLKRVGGSGIAGPLLSAPLQNFKNLDYGSDQIRHNDIIGKKLGHIVKTKRKKLDYRISQPTLAEYTDLTPRLVTPIYSQDASVIVSLLDINPTLPGSDAALDNERLEIFEAGTGHGALTLNLARAIHAANTTPPTTTYPSQAGVNTTPIVSEVESGKEAETNIGAETESLDTTQTAYQTWRDGRRAVLHTLDISGQHSDFAQNVVKNFRSGIYFHHVDFHVGLIEDYLSKRLEDSPTPFLDIAILDLPATNNYLDIIFKALKPSGKLLVFCPNITQINECVLDVKKKVIPLFLEKVVELGASVGSGGRVWDVRPVRPRAYLKAMSEKAANKAVEGSFKRLQLGGEELEGNTSSVPSDVNNTSETQEATPIDDGGGWELVCRPMVGGRVVGGGFVGLWRKMD
ncbi:S-adenosyl-L-methionine-dependent methyltransferase [Tricladium varicosporioides]|nr:S-adenosyl-L-methionine-dependent methyltransferase [Hymenoscyphus varicosporioides]